MPHSFTPNLENNLPSGAPTFLLTFNNKSYNISLGGGYGWRGILQF